VRQPNKSTVKVPIYFTLSKKNPLHHATPPAESTRQGDETRLGCAGRGALLTSYAIGSAAAVRPRPAGRPGGEEVSPLRDSIAAERGGVTWGSVSGRRRSAVWWTGPRMYAHRD